MHASTRERVLLPHFKPLFHRRPVYPDTVNAPRDPSSLAEDLQALWRSATADTIGSALQEARARVAEASPAVQEEVAELLMSLEQLERWLHDR